MVNVSIYTIHTDPMGNPRTGNPYQPTSRMEWRFPARNLGDPHWLGSLHWKIPKMDDDWGYPYDLGNPHIAIVMGIQCNTLKQQYDMIIHDMWVSLKRPNFTRKIQPYLGKIRF